MTNLRLTLLGVAVFLAAFTVTVSVPQVAQSASVPKGNIIGFMEWTCPNPQPRGWVRADFVLTAPTWEAVHTIYHELDHAEYAKTHFTDCADYQRRKVAALPDMEARAFCVSARVAAELSDSPFTGDLPAAVRHFAVQLSWYSFGWSTDEAEAAIWSHCL